MGITEEEVKGKLQELGFQVVAVADQERIGWSIERNGDGWGVYELYRTKGTFDRIAMSLSGRLNSIGECLEWQENYFDRGVL